MSKEVYVVATVRHCNGEELFSDIILVTDNIRKAKIIKYQIKKRKPILNLNYDLLEAYDDAIYFKRTLNEVIQNEDN
jgi:hypothetical protein